MKDEGERGPLGSDELERDRKRAGQDGTLGEKMSSDERIAPGDDGEHGAKGPNPIAGTMLPPD